MFVPHVKAENMPPQEPVILLWEPLNRDKTCLRGMQAKLERNKVFITGVDKEVVVQPYRPRFHTARRNQGLLPAAPWTDLTGTQFTERNLAQRGSHSDSISVKLESKLTSLVVLKVRMAFLCGGDNNNWGCTQGELLGAVDVAFLDPGAGYIAVLTWWKFTKLCT